MASTLDTQARRARYLEALTGLSPHHAHDLRGRFGSVALHLDVAGELLASDSGAAPAAVGRARAEIASARTGLLQLVETLETMLDLARPSPSESQRFDLRELIRNLEATLAPAIRDRKLEWSARVPESPLFVAGERDALRQALIIVMVERLFVLAPGGRLELSVTPAADRVELVIAGVPAPAALLPNRGALSDPDASDTFEIVRATIEPNGGTAREGADARLTLTLPVFPTSR